MAVTNLEDVRRSRAEAEQEEFLTPEEKNVAQGSDEGNRPVFGQPYYKDQESENVLQAGDCGAKYQIVTNTWTPIARKLWKAYSELQECNPSTILFIKVIDGKKKYRGRPVVMDIGTIGQQPSEIYEQLSGCIFSHVIHIYEENANNQSFDQLLVHLYMQMRQIQADGKLRDYGEKSFAEVQASLPRDWYREGAHIPNLIDCGNWGKVQASKQQCLFEEGRAAAEN